MLNSLKEQNSLIRKSVYQKEFLNIISKHKEEEKLKSLELEKMDISEEGPIHCAIKWGVNCEKNVIANYFLQARNEKPKYICTQTGPSHHPSFKVSLELKFDNNEPPVTITGEAATKKEAEKTAALNACNWLVSHGKLYIENYTAVGTEQSSSSQIKRPPQEETQTSSTQSKSKKLKQDAKQKKTPEPVSNNQCVIITSNYSSFSLVPLG
jgi:hypothetical protein